MHFWGKTFYLDTCSKITLTHKVWKAWLFMALGWGHQKHKFFPPFVAWCPEKIRGIYMRRKSEKNCVNLILLSSKGFLPFRALFSMQFLTPSRVKRVAWSSAHWAIKIIFLFLLCVSHLSTFHYLHPKVKLLKAKNMVLPAMREKVWLSLNRLTVFKTFRWLFFHHHLMDLRVLCKRQITFHSLVILFLQKKSCIGHIGLSKSCEI